MEKDRNLCATVADHAQRALLCSMNYRRIEQGRARPSRAEQG